MWVFNVQHQNQPEAKMNNDTKTRLFPSLIDDVLKQPGHCVDNVFASVWKRLNFNDLIQRSGFKKRSGVPIIDSVFLLILWKWIDVSSIAVFARQSLKVFSAAKKDVMYELLKREDIDWRGLNTNVAKTIYTRQNVATSRIKAYVLDDSVRKRRGKKMEGVSCHFDHTEGRHVMGQQVLTLGLVTEALFMPIDSQLYVSESRVQGLIRAFQDGRSFVAKRFDEAVDQSKPEIAKGMLRRAKRHGIQADYLVADAWFGTKSMIETALSLDVVGLLRMKKNKLKYRAMDPHGRIEALDANGLYHQAVKGEWKKVCGMPYRAVTLDVSLDIATDKNKEPNIINVRLLFVRGATAQSKPCVSKKDWALFLTTDPEMSMTEMLEIYALRWSIEVYFKEAKQHLGFLKEQTWTFASHTASIHLTAIRYLMLVYAKHENNEIRICDVRAQMKEQLTTLNFAQRLWQLFRALINGTIAGLKEKLGKMTVSVMEAIDARIDEFFVQALQLDSFTLKMEFNQ